MTGLALAGAGPRGKIGPIAYPLLLAASLLPDSDIVLRLFGSEEYLFGHLGITHSLAGLAFQAVMIAFAFRNYAPSISPIFLVGLSAAGLGLHASMDCLNSWGPQLLSPFSNARFAMDWIADSDVILLIVPGIAFAAGIARPVLRERINRAAFGVMLAYVVMCAGSHAMGTEQIRAAMGKIGIKPDRVDAFPRFADPFSWNGVAWTKDRYFQAEVGSFSGVHGRVRSYFRTQLPPGLKSVFSDQYMVWARVPMIRFTAGRYPNEAVLCDLRYVVAGGRGSYTAVINASPAGPVRRWMGVDENIPDPDMEFELSTK